MTNLPSVNDLIKSNPLIIIDPNGTYDNGLKAMILQNLVVTVSKNAEWAKDILKPDLQSIRTCEKSIDDNPLFKKNGDKHLVDVLDDCIKSGNWEPLFESGGYLRSQGLSPSNSTSSASRPTSFKNAFENEFVEPYPDILLKTMDQYAPKVKTIDKNYYNRSFSIIQSSGMGKSRLVKESAKKRFTFPLNIHEIMKESETYPPFDDNVREYLTHIKCTDMENKYDISRHFFFLEALFTEAARYIADYNKGTPEYVALEWSKWMAGGSTINAVGTNRAAFYDGVIAKAKKNEKSVLSELSDITSGVRELKLKDSETDEPTERRKKAAIDKCEKRLIDAADIFLACLRGLHTQPAEGFLAVVYLDEAHTLHPKGQENNQYFALMKVLTVLTKDRYPSARMKSGNDLIPPFFELPFDCYSTKFTTRAREAGNLTLNGVCQLQQVVAFGRPMWKSYYDVLKPQDKDLTIKLARLKFPFIISPMDERMRSLVAALDCRVHLRYNQLRPESLDLQSNLVKSYMRVVFNIPENRGYMWSGYPSEPILAEAAALLLNDAAENSEVSEYGLRGVVEKTLTHILDGGLLARGERGEMVVRTLLTVAHDLAVAKYPEVSTTELRFHRPIKLLDLLQNLCSKECWQIIKSATPRDNYEGKGPTLERAFKNAWVNFSHFAELNDHKSFNLDSFVELLKRGAAAQASTNRHSWDAAITILFGDPATTPISSKNASVFCMQIKASSTESKVGSLLPEPLEDAETSHPMLSIVFELGVASNSELKLVSFDSKDVNLNTSAGNTRSQANNHIAGRRRHYMITLYGCDSQTYHCITKNSQIYSTLAYNPKPKKEFPRADLDMNYGAFLSLGHYVYGDQMDWSK